MCDERKRPQSEEAPLPEGRRLPIEDERVRAIRNRLRSAKAHIDTAMKFVMWPEVRTELRAVQADLAQALACIGSDGSGSDPFAN